jgi:hypothetical protein
MWPIVWTAGAGVNPEDIIGALVSLFRDIPELVTAMGGDEDRIYSYVDRYPSNVSLETAKYQMPAPGIMVVWQGSGPGRFGGFEAWKHEISIFCRAGEGSESTPSGYWELFRLIVKGVPTAAAPQQMQYVEVHPACQPMDTPSMRRQTDQAGVDYFEVSMTFTENGDN